MSGVERIAAERQRQLEVEGWTPEHDDSHGEGELALAAVCYATPIQLYRRNAQPLAQRTIAFYDPWPWDSRYDRRKRGGNVVRSPSDTATRIRFLEKAGALIAAEIDRLERLLAASSCGTGSGDDEWQA